MKRILTLTLALLLLAGACVLAEGAEGERSAANDLGVGTLVPAPHAAQTDGAAPTALYCGPTQGAYRHGELTLDPGEPYVYFGQYDCWSMVALGTPEAMGPVGWVETAAIDAPSEPELAFADAVQVMIEEDAFLTDEPCAAEPPVLFSLPRGTLVTLLACYGDWGYAQCEVDGEYVRAFFPLSAVL